MNDLDALQAAARLHQLGLVVRSPSLEQLAHKMNDFHARGGNRAMRRAAKRATRSRGR